MYPVSILCLKVYPIQQCVRLHPWAMLLTVGKSRGHVCYPEDTPVMKDSTLHSTEGTACQVLAYPREPPLAHTKPTGWAPGSPSSLPAGS